MTKFSPRGDGKGLEAQADWQGRRANELLVAEEDTDLRVNRRSRALWTQTVWVTRCDCEFLCCVVDDRLIFVTIHRSYRSLLVVGPSIDVFFCVLCFIFWFLKRCRCRIAVFQQLRALNKPSITNNL